MRNVLKLFFSSLFAAIAVCSIPFAVHAADLYIVLDKSQVAEKGTFTGTLYVSTDGTAINNAESTIHFPVDLLSVDSISTSGSIFNIFVEQPTFSNTEGKIYFNGGLPTPGFTGVSGNALRINFRTKKTGSASLTFGTSAVRANDGLGTNVLSQSRGATIQITPLIPTQEPNLAQIGLPKAPVITSEDMPDPEGWYQSSSATFDWLVPRDVTAVQLILSRSPRTEPTILYAPAVSEKLLTNLVDGVLYLNARFKNSTGWSSLASRKIQVDTTAPVINSADWRATSEDLIAIDVEAADALSGIKNIEVYDSNIKLTQLSVDSATTTITKGEPIEIILPALRAGNQRLTIRAYDKAENSIDREVVVTSPMMRAPTITNIPESIEVGSRIEILGMSPYTQGNVLLTFKVGEDSEQILLTPNEERVFAYTSNEIKKRGVITVSAQTVRNDIKSEPSAAHIVEINDTIFHIFGTKAAQIISTVITLLVLIFALIALVYYIIRRVYSWKRALARDLNRNEKDLHNVFEKIRNNNERHLKILQKAHASRTLTKEEQKIFDELSQNLTDVERYLENKMRKIQDMERKG